jgi:PAS domain S-box-containing protein
MIQKHANRTHIIILSLEKLDNDYKTMNDYLLNHSKYGIHLDRVFCQKDFYAAICKQDYDLILGDIDVAEINCTLLIDQVRSKCPETPVICLSDHIGEDRVAELFRLGLTDYISKNNMNGLMDAIERAINSAEDKKNQLNDKKLLVDAYECIHNFFNNDSCGFFIMMLDEPIQWNNEIEKDTILDYVLDHQHIEKANQAFLNIFGYSNENYMSKIPNDFCRYDIKKGRRLWYELFDLGKLDVITCEQGINGEDSWIDGHYFCVYDSDHRIKGYYGIQQDISDKTEEMIALKESENYYKNIFDDLPIEYFSIDEKGRLREINKKWLNLLGYEKEEVIGTLFSDYLTLESNRIFQEKLSKIIKNGSIKGKFKVIHKLGYPIIISINGNLKKNIYGEVKQILCLIEEVTTKRPLENTNKIIG